MGTLKFAITSDNLTYAKCARFIGDKSTLGDDKLHELAGLLGDDEEKASEIILKAKMSMGRELGEADLENVLTFAEKVQSLAGKAQTPLVLCFINTDSSLYKQNTGEPSILT
jgi:nucleolar protein 56